MADKQKTVARGVRIPHEVNTWLKRAGAKKNQSANAFAAEVLLAAFNQRHAK